MKRILPSLSIILAAPVLFSLAASGVHAQENTKEDVVVTKEDVVETKADVKKVFAKDKTGTNPMNFSFDARLYNENRWLNLVGDGNQNLTTFEFRAPFASGKWQFRGKVRAVDLTVDSDGDGTDEVNETGVGDTDLRFMTVPYLNLKEKQALAVGVEFFLDTASEDALGSGADSVAPFVFWGYFNPLGKGSIFVPGYQHIMSFSENDGRDKVRQGLIDMFLVKTWKANQYWGYVDPQILLDYEKNEEYMLIEIQAGMMFGWGKGNSGWLMPSFGVGTDRPYDFSLEVGYKIVW
jgi:hypothetical protein